VVLKVKIEDTVEMASSGALRKENLCEE